MKARDLKNILVPLKLGGKEYKIAFDFNALCELEEVYGDYDQAMKAIGQGKTSLKLIRALVYSAIKPRHEKVTLLGIGEALTSIMKDEEEANYIMGQLQKAMELSAPNQEDVGE